MRPVPTSQTRNDRPGQTGSRNHGYPQSAARTLLPLVPGLPFTFGRWRVIRLREIEIQLFIRITMGPAGVDRLGTSAADERTGFACPAHTVTSLVAGLGPGAPAKTVTAHQTARLEIVLDQTLLVRDIAGRAVHMTGSGAGRHQQHGRQRRGTTPTESARLQRLRYTSRPNAHRRTDATAHPLCSRSISVSKLRLPAVTRRAFQTGANRLTLGRKTSSRYSSSRKPCWY